MTCPFGPAFLVASLACKLERQERRRRDLVRYKIPDIPKPNHSPVIVGALIEVGLLSPKQKKWAEDWCHEDPRNFWEYVRNKPWHHDDLEARVERLERILKDHSLKEI